MTSVKGLMIYQSQGGNGSHTGLSAEVDYSVSFMIISPYLQTLHNPFITTSEECGHQTFSLYHCSVQQVETSSLS